jgi:hypothetical protein
MTDEELNKMIGEFLPYPAEGQYYALKQFAKLIAAAEREAIASILDKYDHNVAPSLMAKAIRARGKE